MFAAPPPSAHSSSRPRQRRVTRRAARLAIASLLTLPVWFSNVSHAQTNDALLPCADPQHLQRAVARLNEVRQTAAPCDGAVAGASTARQPLAWEQRLATSAQAHASDLALRDLLSHVDAQQRSFGVRLRSAGYAAAGAGENLAAGQTDFDDTLQAWLASPTHCANLMQPDFRDVGLACVQRPGSRYERFWVAHMGVPVRRITPAVASAPALPNGELLAAR